MTPRDRIVHPDKSIRVVGRQAQTLSRLAAQWPDLFEDERIAFALEWSNTMSHLRTVEELRSAGELTEAQEREYTPVRARVAEILPTIKRLGLAEPGIPLG